MAEALLQKFVTAVNSNNLDQANEILGELNVCNTLFYSLSLHIYLSPKLFLFLKQFN